MDLTGRIEAALSGMAAALPGFGANIDPAGVLSQCAVGVGTQKGFMQSGPPLRMVYHCFGYCALLPNSELYENGTSAYRGIRWTLECFAHDAAMLLRQSEARAVDLLWHHWLLLQADRWKVRRLDEDLAKRLWNRGFAMQSAAGNLHPMTAESTQESFVYDELCAIHAAYRSAMHMRDTKMRRQVGRAVEYHVANTQPDFSTTEPWGLAAFAALDPTETFADQQLHDAMAGAGGMIVMALLADALLAMRDSSGAAR